MTAKNNRFTNKDLYDMFTHRFDRVDIKLDRLGERVRILEVWRANLMGKITALLLIVSFIGNVIFTWVKEKF